MTRHALYVESYGAGSHLSMLETIQRTSRHCVRPVVLGPGHWRWRHLAAHFELTTCIRDAIATGPIPDVVILSGPMNVAALVASLPAALQDVPRVRYFHESQWTYPARDFDARPYVVAHIDAVRLCSASWFNSEYHRQVFWSHAINSVSARVRRLAQGVLPEHWHRTRVVYPPIEVDLETKGSGRRKHPRRIVWAARWEEEKRPDLFVSAVQELVNRGVDFDLALLGPASLPNSGSNPDLDVLEPHIAVRGPLQSRRDYERVLNESALFVSTADQEFFGIAALEASVLGAVPVLPYALAYPETLPAAWFYRQHDLADLVRVITAALQTEPLPHSIRSDALRFGAVRTVPAFDDAIESVIATSLAQKARP